MALADTMLALAGLLAVSVLAAGLLRRVPVPETVVLVLIGIALGEAAARIPALSTLEALQLEPELVFFVFLPVLIFESGLDLDARQLARDLGPVLALAVPALLASATLVGIGLHLVLGIGIGAALVFGALISATDPVAVVALFKELGAPLRLTTLVEGESLLNDATAVVVVSVLLGILANAGDLGAATVAGAAARFVWVFLGGAALGVVAGLLTSELVHRLACETEEILMLSLVAAYASFVLAEHGAGVSGVMASGAAAVTIGSYGASRVRAETSRAVLSTWRLIARICNAFLFILIGFAVDAADLGSHALPVILAIVLVLAARAAVVYTLTPLATRAFALPRITLGERHIMFWGGLKGALAIAVALSLPEEFPDRDLILHLTLGVVLFTLLVNAPTIRPLMTHLGLSTLDADERAELALALATARERAGEEAGALREAGVIRRSAERRVRRRIARAFEGGSRPASTAHLARAAYLSSLRTELETLRTVHDLGLVSQYTYLDMRNTLQLERERHVGGRPGEGSPANLFARLERAVVRELREHDRAAWLLARYQRVRLVQRARRDMAGVLTVRAALAALAGHDQLGVEARERLSADYRVHLDARLGRLRALREEFPRFAEHLETVIGTRMALAAALDAATRGHEHGELGAKIHARVRGAASSALDAVPGDVEDLPDPDPRELLATVPLLADLSDEALAKLAGHARRVEFLTDDILVGEEEHGDALYVIVVGQVEVVRGEERVATLGPGEFLGEGALLGDAVRNATVRALTPLSALRLTRDDVLALAVRYPEVGERLRTARDARTSDGN